MRVKKKKKRPPVMLLTELESERDDDDDDDRTICANGEKHRVQFVWRGREGGKMRRSVRKKRKTQTNENHSARCDEWKTYIVIYWTRDTEDRMLMITRRTHGGNNISGKKKRFLFRTRLVSIELLLSATSSKGEETPSSCPWNRSPRFQTNERGICGKSCRP